jgi:hypothetical protein
MLTRKKYIELDVCGEEFGSWGSQGIEVACKTWLSGGEVMCYRNTWYAHLFRTQGGDFGFPYKLSGNQVEKAKKHAKDLFWNGKWDQQIYSVSSLVEKFWPIRENDPKHRGWNVEDLEALKAMEPKHLKKLQGFKAAPTSVPVKKPINGKPTKGIIYYTDNRLDPLIEGACQFYLLRGKLPIVSASLKSIEFGHNIVLPLKRGYVTMFKQILAALEKIDTDIVFFAEHDVLYHPSHFTFTPSRDDLFYYNNNMWKVDYETGKSLFHYSNHTSQLCAYRSLLLEHYRKRVRMCEELGDKLQVRRMGFEPGTHGRKERVDDYKCDTWMSPTPNIDIRHSGNLTSTRWDKTKFRNDKYTKGWKESDGVPGWYSDGHFKEMLR